MDLKCRMFQVLSGCVRVRVRVRVCETLGNILFSIFIKYTNEYNILHKRKCLHSSGLYFSAFVFFSLFFYFCHFRFSLSSFLGNHGNLYAKTFFVI